MRISSVIIGLLLVTGVITGLYTFVNSLASDEAYAVNVDSQYLTRFGAVDNISSEINEDYDELKNWSTKKRASYEIITLVPDALSLFKNTITLPFAIGSDIAGGIIEAIGFEGAWVKTFVITVICLILVFAFLALVLRYKYV